MEWIYGLRAFGFTGSGKPALAIAEVPNKRAPANPCLKINVLSVSWFILYIIMYTIIINSFHPQDNKKIFTSQHSDESVAKLHKRSSLFPSSEVTHIFPPICSTNPRQIANPSPTPLLQLSNWTKRLNMESILSLGIPSPLSSTKTRQKPPFSYIQNG